jgi:hypothetical protein
VHENVASVNSLHANSGVDFELVKCMIVSLDGDGNTLHLPMTVSDLHCADIPVVCFACRGQWDHKDSQGSLEKEVTRERRVCRLVVVQLLTLIELLQLSVDVWTGFVGAGRRHKTFQRGFSQPFDVSRRSLKPNAIQEIQQPSSVLCCSLDITAKSYDQIIEVIDEPGRTSFD